MASKIPAERKGIAEPVVSVEDPTTQGKAVITGEQAALAAFDATKPGRDGTGAYLTTATGVVLPDGSYVPAGGTFDAGTENVSTAQLEGWQRSGLVVANKVTKELKADLIKKG